MVGIGSAPYGSPGVVSRRTSRLIVAADAIMNSDRMERSTNQGPVRGARWFRSTWALGLASGLLLWLAFPPVDWGFLAWVAPCGWLLLIRGPQLSGWRPYLILYGVGWLYFGATFYWIMLPHVAAIFGWIALTTYLGCYLPVFVFLARVAVHQLRIPLLFAAPLVWTGLEFVRAHIVTGFLMAALAHTQHRWLAIIQISDLFGGYGLTFLIMFVAAGLASLISYNGSKRSVWPLLPAAVAILITLFYGYHKLNVLPGPLGPRVALIQGNIDTQFDRDPRESQQLIQQEYWELTRKALEDPGPLSIVVWPESMATIPRIEIDKGAWIPAEEITAWGIMDAKEAALLEASRQLPDVVHRLAAYSQDSLVKLAHEIQRTRKKNVPDATPVFLVVGTDAEQYGKGKLDRYNTSLCLRETGEILSQYHKMHLVMFGEYVPWGDRFPSLYDWTPLPSGLTPGNEATIYEISGTKFSPSICYETVLPHVIRRQLLELQAREQSPDVLLSQTNDGWFWGSAALDMHLICGVFRAVEFRLPLLIAANTGFSASIDGRGRVLARGPRRETAILFTEPQLEPLKSFYLVGGDLLGGACGIFSIFLVGWSIFLALRSDPHGAKP